MWRHISAYLGGRGVDAYKIVKVGLLGAQLDHPAITLGNLSCIGTQVVETNHLFLQRKRIRRFKQKLLNDLSSGLLVGTLHRPAWHSRRSRAYERLSTPEAKSWCDTPGSG